MNLQSTHIVNAEPNTLLLCPVDNAGYTFPSKGTAIVAVKYHTIEEINLKKFLKSYYYRNLNIKMLITNKLINHNPKLSEKNYYELYYYLIFKSLCIQKKIYD